MFYKGRSLAHSQELCQSSNNTFKNLVIVWVLASIIFHCRSLLAGHLGWGGASSTIFILWEISGALPKQTGIARNADKNAQHHKQNHKKGLYRYLLLSDGTTAAYNCWQPLLITAASSREVASLGLHSSGTTQISSFRIHLVPSTR